ncbi:transmembrane protein, putative [Medicago truncatula]|uniref:Transmembrane protein, putative n=1 Tax=Medicago truncatula TaxID=3880 RepID=G7JTS9_MEDTR|nr:transmembrane protein, putative [Medicago truncatula]
MPPGHHCQEDFQHKESDLSIFIDSNSRSFEVYLYRDPATVTNGYVRLWVPSFPTKFPSVTSTCGAGAFGRNVSSVKAVDHKQPHTLFSTFFCVWGRSFPTKQILGNVSCNALFYYLFILLSLDVFL